MTERASSVEVGAGGIVRRRSPGGDKIALVHRKEHGDWVLPKGHPQDGETWEEAALREVREETGCKAHIERIVGPFSYEKQGHPKVVLIFDMIVDDEQALDPNVEVDEVAWLLPAAAERRLTYPAERKIVSDHFGLAGKRIGRLPRRESLNEERLRTVLNVQGPWIRAQLRLAGAESAKEQWWAEVAEELLERSEIALRDKDIDEGWRALHAVKRLQFYGFDQAALRDARSALLAEANKKASGWRLATIRERAGKDGEPIDPGRLASAQETLDEHFGNVYLRLKLYSDRLRWPLAFLATLLLVFVVAAGLGWLPEDWQVLNTWQGMSIVIFSGMLGAMLSTSISTFRRGANRRIPDVVGRGMEPLFRLVVGGASAIVVVLVLETNLQTVLDAAEAGMLPFAVAAGFTERLVTRMMASLESAAGKEPQPSA